jgi:chemotaxis protein MotB
MANTPVAAIEAIRLAERRGRRGERGGGGEMQRRTQMLASEVTKVISDPALSGRAQVHVEERGVVVSLTEAGFFESGSAELRAGALAGLDVLGSRLAKREDPIDIIVEGHTDNVTIRNARYRSNWELSTARATFVVANLVEKHKIDPARLTAAGYAEHRPVASNSTVEGRARNRRVDIVLRPMPAPSQEPEVPDGPVIAPAPSPSPSPSPSKEG